MVTALVFLVDGTIMVARIVLTLTGREGSSLLDPTPVAALGLIGGIIDPISVALGLLSMVARRAEVDRTTTIAELGLALARVKTLSGLLPICASCKRIRDENGAWQPVETYVRDHSEASVHSSTCPDCRAKERRAGPVVSGAGEPAR